MSIRGKKRESILYAVLKLSSETFWVYTETTIGEAIHKYINWYRKRILLSPDQQVLSVDDLFNSILSHVQYPQTNHCPNIFWNQKPFHTDLVFSIKNIHKVWSSGKKFSTITHDWTRKEKRVWKTEIGRRMTDILERKPKKRLMLTVLNFTKI